MLNGLRRMIACEASQPAESIFQVVNFHDSTCKEASAGAGYADGGAPWGRHAAARGRAPRRAGAPPEHFWAGARVRPRPARL